MTLRIGDILVQTKNLTEQQRDEILEEQRLQGRPFGLLAELMFGVDPSAVEVAWSEQFGEAAGRVDLDAESIDPMAVEAISARQAWQFRVLPMRVQAGELLICTTRRDLPRALRFANTHLDRPVSMVVTDPVALGCALEKYYPMGGFDADQFASDFATLVRKQRGPDEEAA